MTGYRVWVLLLLLLPVFTSAAYADAARGPAVEVPAGRPCLSAEALAAQIRAWLGTTRVDSSVHVFADEAADGGSSARFQVRQGRRVLAQRRFDPAPPDCVQRQAVMALAIALVLEASLLEQLSEAAADVHARSAPAHLSLAALLTRSVAVLPESASGGTLLLSWARDGWFGVRAHLSAQGRRGIALRDADGEFGAGLYALGIDGCAHTQRSGRLAGALCIGVASGLLALRGHGFERSYVARDAWAAAIGTVSGHLKLTPRIALQAQLALHLLLTPIQVESRAVSGELEAARSLDAAGLSVGLGPAFTFR